MNRRIIGADLLLLITAAVWGFGFVAQRSGMQYVGPFAFNGIRFLLGSLSLFPLIAWRRRNRLKMESARGGKAQGIIGKQPLNTNSPRAEWIKRKTLFRSSFLAGTCLFIGVTLQQLGMMATTAGNAGFITGLYVVLTPVFGIFLGRKTGKPTWIAAILTFAGLYLLSSSGIGSMGFNPGDLIVAIGGVFWAFHVLIIDRLVQSNDPLELSSGQFAFAGIYALIAAFLVEPLLSSWLGALDPSLLSFAGTSGLFSWKSLPALINGLHSGALPLSLVSSALVPILYGAFGSVGIGYTLQVVAQKNAPPAHATIILCLEGCFAALGGVLLLHEPIGPRTILGFTLMMAGMLISQWELISRASAKERFGGVC